MNIGKSFIKFSLGNIKQEKVNAEKLNKKEEYTTMALGEEGGGSGDTVSFSSQAAKNKIGNTATTLALGEEGGGVNYLEK